jgi:hypothetical protein
MGETILPYILILFIMTIFKKIIHLYLILHSSFVLFAQKKELIIFDKATNLTIEAVNIYYPILNEGTFTNSDGKALINIKNFDLKISHINYEDILISANDLKTTTKIELNSKSLQLEEVVINSFNLKKNIKYIIDNYENLYVNTPFEKECVFKETLMVDNNLKRLILTKVNWWGKSYKVKYMTDLKLRLGGIDYNKNEPMNIFYDVPSMNVPSRSGYIEPSSLINTLYLNTFLTTIQNFAENAITKIENSPSDQIIVSFETDWKDNTKFQYRETGKIIFSKSTKAILDLTLNNEYKNNIVKTIINENKKEFTNDTKTTTIKLSFYNSLSEKLSLKSLEIIANAVVNYNNKIHNVIVENNVFAVKEYAVKKVNNDGKIDLTKPIFQSLPTNTISNSNSITLTEKEMSFINGNK